MALLGKVGVIRVLTTDDPKVLNEHGRIIESAHPGVTCVSRCISDQPQGVFDAETEAISESKVLQLAVAMAGEGVQALIVSCMAEPGLGLAREHVPIPVIGPASAGAAVASVYGDRIGVAGITQSVPEAIASALGKRLVDYIHVRGVNTTVDLFKPEAQDAVVETGRKLASQGLDAILLGCTGMSTIGIAPRIAAAIKLPVIDPIQAAGLMAWSHLRTLAFSNGT